LLLLSGGRREGCASQFLERAICAVFPPEAKLRLSYDIDSAPHQAGNYAGVALGECDKCLGSGFHTLVSKLRFYR